jgi:hypothetical protein
MLDDTGVAIPGADVDACTLTLYEKLTGAIVNGVSASNILNTGRGTWDANGNLEVQLGPSDNTIVGSADIETHVAKILYTYNTDVVGRLDVEFSVRDLG